MISSLYHEDNHIFLKNITFIKLIYLLRKSKEISFGNGLYYKIFQSNNNNKTVYKELS